MSKETESRNVAVVDANRRCSPDGQHSRGGIGAMKLRRIKDLPSSPREYLEPIGEAPGLRGKRDRRRRRSAERAPAGR